MNVQTFISNLTDLLQEHLQGKKHYLTFHFIFALHQPALVIKAGGESHKLFF